MTSIYRGPGEKQALAQDHNGTTAQGYAGCLCSGHLGGCKQEIVTPKKMLSLGPRSR